MDNNLSLPKNVCSPPTVPNRQRSQPQNINVVKASRNTSPPIQEYISGASQSPYQPNSRLVTHSIRAIDRQAQLPATPPSDNDSFVNSNTKRPEYSTYSARQLTYSHFPHLLPTPDSLAEAGFYYIGLEDKVACYQCNVGIKKWKPANDPWSKHARFNSRCDYVRHVKGEQFIHDKQIENSARVSSDEQLSMPTAQRQESSLGTTAPRHPKQKTQAERMKTLEGLSLIAQTNKELSEAGIFYCSTSNSLRCFQCGGGFNGWSKEDIPAIKHLYLYPECSYIRSTFDETSINLLKSLFSQQDELDSQASFNENTSAHIFACFKESTIFRALLFVYHSEEEVAAIEKAFIYCYFRQGNQHPDIEDIALLVCDILDTKENKNKQLATSFYEKHQENSAKTKKLSQEQKNSRPLKLKKIRDEIKKTFLVSRQHREKENLEKQKKSDEEFSRQLEEMIRQIPFTPHRQLGEMGRHLQNEVEADQNEVEADNNPRYTETPPLFGPEDYEVARQLQNEVDADNNPRYTETSPLSYSEDYEVARQLQNEEDADNNARPTESPPQRHPDQPGHFFNIKKWFTTFMMKVARPIVDTQVARATNERPTETHPQRQKPSSAHATPPPHQHTLQDLEALSTCVICVDNPRGITFSPCKHMVTCDKCADKIAHCPMCRAPIKKKLKSFMI